LCDTSVALGSVTRDKKVYLAKNSDRDPNEAQYLQIVDGGKHAAGEKVKCTHIEIPQVDKTNRVLLSRPFWMWGAEMGANEHGVSIGNEALFTRLKASKEPGLIGMDFLRLALERSECAEEALHVIIELLEQYGQSGNCAYDHTLVYQNGFLIADRKEAWVLETAGKQWAALKVKDHYSISNQISIGSKWDLASEDLVRIALDRNWCKKKEDFNFSKCYSDLVISTTIQPRQRRACASAFLKGQAGKIDLDVMLSLLRMHAPDGREWSPDRSLTEWTLCVHKGFGPIRASQSVASLVSRLSEDGDIHFATGTSAPCLSLFKPVWLDAGLPAENDAAPSGMYDDASLWWQHELLHREVLKDFAHRSGLFTDERDRVEKGWIADSLAAVNTPRKARRKISQDAFEQSVSLTAKWRDKVKKEEKKTGTIFYYDWEWRKNNRKAKIPV
jgi:dipeptidase